MLKDVYIHSMFIITRLIFGTDKEPHARSRWHGTTKRALILITSLLLLSMDPIAGLPQDQAKLYSCMHVHKAFCSSISPYHPQNREDFSAFRTYRLGAPRQCTPVDSDTRLAIINYELLKLDLVPVKSMSHMHMRIPLQLGLGLICKGIRRSHNRNDRGSAYEVLNNLNHFIV